MLEIRPQRPRQGWACPGAGRGSQVPFRYESQDDRVAT